MTTSETMRLEGYSGYEVTLFRDGKSGGYYVRKKAGRIDQNRRLLAQYRKHDFFCKKKNKYFSVPQIIDQGYERSLFWYSYRFIEGTTLLHFLERAPLPRTHAVLDRLLSTLESYARDSTAFESISGKFFPALKNKMYDSYTRIGEGALPRELLERFERRIVTARFNLSPTLCHGDFTLDNIIVDRDLHIWLIDFVEVFYPHWWLDISKFFQDVDGGWYELTRGVRLQYNKLMYARDYLLRGIEAFDKRYLSAHSFLVALHLLRNIPFLKDSPHRSADAKRDTVVKKIYNLLDQ